MRWPQVCYFNNMSKWGKKNKAWQNIAVISIDLEYASRTLATKIIYLDAKWHTGQRLGIALNISRKTLLYCLFSDCGFPFCWNTVRHSTLCCKRVEKKTDSSCRKQHASLNRNIHSFSASTLSWSGSQQIWSSYSRNSRCEVGIRPDVTKHHMCMHTHTHTHWGNIV